MARGWPSWGVGLAILTLVVVVLGAAFVLNARLRPKVGIEPAATAIPSVAPTTMPTTVPSPMPTAAAAASSPTTTIDPSAEKAVVAQSYLQYWDVYDNALLSLDTSKLSDVAAEAELTRDTQTVNDLRSAQQALKSDVTHHLEVTSVSSDAATVHDQFEDRSYLIDPVSMKALQTPAPPRIQAIACQLQRINGTWKVVNIVKVSVTVVSQ